MKLKHIHSQKQPESKWLQPDSPCALPTREQLCRVKTVMADPKLQKCYNSSRTQIIVCSRFTSQIQCSKTLFIDTGYASSHIAESTLYGTNAPAMSTNISKRAHSIMPKDIFKISWKGQGSSDIVLICSLWRTDIVIDGIHWLINTTIHVSLSIIKVWILNFLSWNYFWGE